MKVKKIAIIGGGNGGATAAADIASRGFSVSWFELPEFASNLEEAKNKGGLTFITKEGSQFVKIDTISTNLTEVMDGADVVMLAVPTNVIEEFAKLCAPHIEAGQIILINSAACAGSFRFARVAQRLGITTKFLIAETNSLAYGTRFDARKAEVNMLLRTKKLHLAAFPSSDTESVLAACRQFYEFLVPAKNVWETTLNNGNPESHTGPGLLNAGRIEYSKGEFYLYKEGITEHTVNLVKAVDNERQAICKELGFEAIPKEERVVQMGYAKPLKTLQEQYNTNMLGIQSGQIDIAFGYATTASEALQGIGPFEDSGKVENVRQLVSLYISPLQLAVRGDSDVYSVEDLKGRGFSPTVKGMTSELMFEMVLNVHDMSYDDLSRVEFVNQPEGAALTQDGHIEGFCPLAAVPAPSIQEVFASARGGRIVPIDESKFDKIWEVNPGYAKYVIPAGSYRGQNEDVLTVAVPDALYVREDLPDEIVETLLKILFEKRDDFEAIHSQMKDFSLETASEDFGTPLHPVAEKFFKDQGAL